jgi:hypothetical protein
VDLGQNVESRFSSVHGNWEFLDFSLDRQLLDYFISLFFHLFLWDCE